MITDKSSIQKILVVTLSNLGDVVLTLPVFEQLKLSFPEAKLDVIAGESGKIVFEGDPRIDQFRVFNKRAPFQQKWAFIQSIRNERYDLVIDLRRSLIGLLSGARYRNSYITRSKGAHRGEKHLASLKGLVSLFPVEQRWLERRSPNDSTRPMLDRDKPTIIAAVGSKSDIKKWPAVHYAQLLDRLAHEKGFQIVLVGDKADAKDAERVRSSMKQAALNVCGETTFLELVSLVRRAKLVITNDSAPLHIADALKVPVLALFGPTDPAKYGPRTKGSASLSLKIFCSPCEKAQCRYGHECLSNLSVETVYHKASQILEDRLRGQGLRFLVMRLDRVGDLVLTLPSIYALRQQHPDAHITVMTRPYTQDLLREHPWIDEVLVYDYKKGGAHTFPWGYSRFIREIRRRSFDAAFVMHPGIRSYLIPFLSAIPYRIGYQNNLSFLLTHAMPDKRHLGLEHESEYALHLVEAFGVPRPTQMPDKLLFPETRVDLAKREGVIAIHAGASCPSKRWPKENYRRLIESILAFHSHRVAIIGGEDEVSLGAYLSKGFDERVQDWTGRQNLNELTAFLSVCDALVSNDSGPVHVAAAVGTPVVSIFGRNQAGLGARRWQPLGASHRVLHKDIGCVVCLAHACTIDFECLKAIRVEEVYQSLATILTRQHEKKSATYQR